MRTQVSASGRRPCSDASSPGQLLAREPYFDHWVINNYTGLYDQVSVIDIDRVLYRHALSILLNRNLKRATSWATPCIVHVIMLWGEVRVSEQMRRLRSSRFSPARSVSGSDRQLEASIRQKTSTRRLTAVENGIKARLCSSLERSISPLLLFPPLSSVRSIPSGRDGSRSSSTGLRLVTCCCPRC